jgi:hypothetical protein
MKKKGTRQLHHMYNSMQTESRARQENPFDIRCVEATDTRSRRLLCGRQRAVGVLVPSSVMADKTRPQGRFYEFYFRRTGNVLHFYRSKESIEEGLCQGRVVQCWAHGGGVPSHINRETLVLDIYLYTSISEQFHIQLKTIENGVAADNSIYLFKLSLRQKYTVLKQRGKGSQHFPIGRGP